MVIKKRDGSTQDFDLNKIITAVDKAFKATKGWEQGISKNFKDSLEHIQHWADNVEGIQNQVEEQLNIWGFYEVAKNFILYRASHKEVRALKNRIDYMENYSQSSDNAATSSETDPNANIQIKNIANLNGEVYKVYNRKIQRLRMKHQLQKDFPEVAEDYAKDINHHIIYIHDEASTPAPDYYCSAVQMYPFLEKGTSTMDGLGTTPPKNLDSFCGQFVNLAFLLSSQAKGAIGFAEFFNFFDWACVQEWGENYHEKEKVLLTTAHCKKQRTISDTIEQSFQNIVYSINQPAGNRSYQSPL